MAIGGSVRALAQKLELQSALLAIAKVRWLRRDGLEAILLDADTIRTWVEVDERLAVLHNRF